MELRDFVPVPPLDPNAPIVLSVEHYIEIKAEAWPFLNNATIRRSSALALHSLYRDYCSYVTGETKEAHDYNHDFLRKVCAILVQYIKQPYSASYSFPIQKQRTITVDVPMERKVGLFKKETYIEKQTRTETYTETQTVTYKGWVLDRFYRMEGAGAGASYLVIDYCLGADGKLYTLLYEQGKGFDPLIMECTLITPGVISDTYCNIYNHILGGSIGALDAISAFPNHPSRKVSRTLDGDSFTVNFPLQIDDPATYPYKYLDGTLARIVKLMTEEEKAAVLADYTMDKLFEREIV